MCDQKSRKATEHNVRNMLCINAYQTKDRDIILENGIQQGKWVPMTSRTPADLKYYTFKTMQLGKYKEP